MTLKPQDVLVVLKLFVGSEKATGEKTYSELASELGMSASEVHAAVRRASEAGLLDLSDQEKRHVLSRALYDYLVHGVPRSFPVKPGPIVHGMPTAHAAPPLSSSIKMGDSLPPVWADADGTTRGYELMPLYKSVPKAARNDSRLYELLALVDALRAGRARERRAAATELRNQLLRRAAPLARLGANITENDLDSWSGTLTGSEAVLPELVRRIATDLIPCKSVVAFSSPANKAVNQPGFDCELHTLGGSRFASTDRSLWELSTRKDIRQKASEDYNKALAVVEPRERNCTTYVTLTSRIWRNPGKSEWLQEKRIRKEWADVRAYDASDIAQWLTQALSARMWFSRNYYAASSFDIVLMDDYFARWSARTAPEICEEIVFAGRNRERETILHWLGLEPRALFSTADTLEESVVFICAVLRKSDDDSVRQWKGRVVIATTAKAWEEVKTTALTSVNPLVLIPAFCEFDGVLLGTEGHYVFIPRERGAAVFSGMSGIELGPIPRRALAEALEGRFTRDADEAGYYAQKSGGKLSALQRLFGYSPPLPDWVNKEKSEILCAFLLAGAWEPGNATDRERLSSLAGGVDYGEIESSVCRLMAVSDPPLRRQGDTIKWRSRVDAWARLSAILTPSSLSRFGDICKDVLGKDSPRYALASEERMFASIRGAVLSESSTVRLGLAEGLALMKQYADTLNDMIRPIDAVPVIDATVQHILSGDWKRWATLESELPSLAEAAPKQFLDSVDAALNDASTDFAELFCQDSVPNDFFGNCCHAGLLWALECLAWHPKYFPLVADILSRLCQLDKGGSYSNRPKESLLQIFHPLTKQTGSENRQRLAVLRGLVERQEDTVWPIIRGILGIISRGCSVSANYRPRFSDWDLPESLEHYPMREVMAYDAEIKAVAAKLIIGHVGRMLELFNEGGADAVIDELLSHIIEHGREFRSESDVHANALQEALRQWVSRQYAKAEDDAPEPEGVSKANAAIETLAPHEVIAQEAWLFAARYVTLRNRLEWSLDYKTRDAYLQEKRNLAFDRIMPNGPDFSQILALVDVSAADPRTVGRSFADRDGAAKFDEDVLALHLADEELHGKFSRAFLSRRTAQEGTPWLVGHAEALIRQGRSTDAVSAITCSESNADIRDWVDTQPAEFQDNYWQRVELWSPSVRDDDDFERIVTAVLKIHRWDQAIELLSDMALKKAPFGRSADYLRILWYPRDGAGSDEEIAGGLRHHASSYAIPATFIHLDSCGDVSSRDLAELEVYYNRCLEHSVTVHGVE